MKWKCGREDLMSRNLVKIKDMIRKLEDLQIKISN